MAFTHFELFALENPYERLSDGDSLASNASLLNKLAYKEQLRIATKIIAGCPESKFKKYGLHIKAIESLNQDKDTFHSVLDKAYQVRQGITSLLDPNNPNPHGLFLGNEFNPSLFHRFEELSNQLLEGNEQAIAERLALCVPTQDQSKLAYNVRHTFSQKTLSEKLQLALVLRRDIERLLLSDNPEKFFMSRDYNEEACKAFINLFRILLEGKEEEIGTKLGALQSENARASIKRQLALLHTEAFDETNPFKLVADSLSVKESLEQKKMGSQAKNPNNYFNNRTTTHSFHNPLPTIEEEGNESFSDEENFSLHDREEVDEIDGILIYSSPNGIKL